MNLKTAIKVIISFVLISSCSLDPKYKTPEIDLPFSEADKSKKQISLVSWEEFFESSELQKVIKLALENNRDLKISALNIESAWTIHGSQRANLLPNISVVASKTMQKAPSAFAAFTPKQQFRANLVLTSYEIDFFGRLRSLKKSALEDYLATKEANNVVKISLISEVANSYIQLLADLSNLKFSEEALELQNKKFQLIEKRYNNGIDSPTVFFNAKSNLENARSSNETYKKLVAQDKNALMLLIGIFDEKLLPIELQIDNVKINESLLDFVTSKNLLLRPDVKKAEHDLKSANANIGAARAAFFPSITLTGNQGYNSRELKTLFDNPSRTFSPQVNLPIFNGGSQYYSLKNANLQKKIEIINYEKAIQTAFSETLDQLSERQALESQLKSADESLKSIAKISEISDLKLQLGAINSLSDIDAKLNMLSNKQSRTNVKKDYIANLITLYKVMGGGSEIEYK